MKFRTRVRLELPRHDAALVAVATGPGVLQPFWAVRKPYQPTSDEFQPIVVGISSALWTDADGDGTRTSPHAYAERLVEQHGRNAEELRKHLLDFDIAVKQHVIEMQLPGGLK